MYVILHTVIYPHNTDNYVHIQMHAFTHASDSEVIVIADCIQLGKHLSWDQHKADFLI